MARGGEPSIFDPVSLLATWFGSGCLPGAPGTWGSLAALPFGVALTWFGGPWLLAAGVIAVFLIGLWASGRYAATKAVKDPGAVVIDEVAGQWIALIPAGLDPWLAAFAFIVFRVFDVTKPWPVGWIDRTLTGGLGIMLDDVVAGAYAGILCFALSRWIGSGI